MVELNREYSELWPNVTVKSDPLPDADAFKDVTDKFEKHFSANPGQET